MHEKTVIPSLTYSLECWSNFSQTDWDDLERDKATAIRAILHLSQLTPFWRILKETAKWLMKQRVEYQKTMRYHQVMHFDDKQVAKQVVEDQQ